MPAWMAGAEGLAYRIHRQVRMTEDEPFMMTEEDVDVLPTSLRWDDSPQRDGQVRETLEIGLPYARLVETVQFVKRTQTGTSGRVRPARIIDAAVDFVLPSESADARETLNLRDVTFTVVPYSLRGRRRSLAGKPPRTASGRIYSVRYPARLGWRDRIAIELRSTRHVEIAGVAYRAAA